MAVNSKDIETLWKQYSEEGGKKGYSVAQYILFLQRRPVLAAMQKT